jgi:cysteinyl-tRNA synthetase
VLRYLLLTAHYRNPLDYSEESLETARNGVDHLYRTINDYTRTQEAANGTPTLLNDEESQVMAEDKLSFLKALNDDLNTPEALAVFYGVLSGPLRPSLKIQLAKEFAPILGLNIEHALTNRPENEVELAKKVKEYEQYRASKQFVQSDALRKDIEALGYSVRDTEHGPYLVKKFF